jgi:hypothetical protein
MGGVQITFGINDQGFSSGVERIRKQTKQLKGELDRLGDVSPMQAASGAIRLLEGDITRNVRAVEKFISSIPGVSTALKNAFPVVGALAFAGVVYRVGEEATKAIQKVLQAPQAISNSFRELNLGAESSIDTLRLSTAKMNEQIALLTGKRPNELAIELAEASVAADKLASSLDNDQRKLSELMKTNGLSAFAGFLGRSGTADVEGSVNSFDQQMADLAARRQHAVRTGNISAAQDLLKQLDDKRAAALAYANSQVTKRQNQGVGGLNQDANIAILTGFRNTLVDQGDQEQAEKQNTASAAQLKKIEDAKKAAELQKQAQEAMVAQWRKDLDSLQALYGRDLAMEVQFWDQRAMLTKRGGLATVQAIDEANKAIAEIRTQATRGQKEFDRTAAQSYLPGSMDLTRGDTSDMQKEGQAAVEYLRNLNEGIALQHANADAIEEASIRMAEMAGRTSKLAEAQALAALHTREYKEATDALATALANAQSLPDGFEKQQRIAGLRNQGTQMAGQRSIQVMQDQQSISGNTIDGAARDSLSKMVQAFDDLAANLKAIIPRTIESMNQDIVNVITGQGRKGDFGRTFLDAGQGMLKAAMQKAEGSALIFLTHGAIGPKRDGSSAQSALYVIQTDAAMGAPSSIQTSSPARTAMLSMADLIPGGSFIRPFISSLIPHAGGGDVLAGRGYLVGERGPEPFFPGVSGTMLPNSSLGGGDTHVYHIDARGATDPAAIHAAVARALPHAVAASMQVHHQSAMRKPQGR